MNITRLRSLGQLKNILSYCSPCQTAYIPLQLRTYARKPTNNPDDAPIKFTESGAVYGIADIRSIHVDDTPWYQGIVCTLSVAVFLLYFLVLREENDIDQIFERSLYDRIDGLEVINLKVARQYYANLGDKPEVRKIDARLKELEEIKKHGNQ